MKQLKNVFLASMVILLTACGGGNSNTDPDQTTTGNDSEYMKKLYKDAAEEKAQLDRLCGDDLDCRIRLFNEKTERMKTTQ